MCSDRLSQRPFNNFLCEVGCIPIELRLHPVAYFTDDAIVLLPER